MSFVGGRETEGEDGRFEGRGVVRCAVNIYMGNGARFGQRMKGKGEGRLWLCMRGAVFHVGASWCFAFFGCC